MPLRNMYEFLLRQFAAEAIGPAVYHYCTELGEYKLPGSDRPLAIHIPHRELVQKGIWFHHHIARHSPEGENSQYYILGMVPKCHNHDCTWDLTVAEIDFCADADQSCIVTCPKGHDEWALILHSEDSAEAIHASLDQKLDEIERESVANCRKLHYRPREASSKRLTA